MSVKSRESVKALDRPFAPEVLTKAKKVAAEYQVILSCEEGHWYGRGLELPNVFGDGKTVAQCVADTREALTGAVAYLLEEGQKPPAPARAGTRTQQVNVRLTAEERALLEATAKRKDYNGLSDFLRAVAVEASK
jgi:predicted RNase H-like HicB family nuclease